MTEIEQAEKEIENELGFGLEAPWIMVHSSGSSESINKPYRYCGEHFNRYHKQLWDKLVAEHLALTAANKRVEQLEKELGLDSVMLKAAFDKNKILQELLSEAGSRLYRHHDIAHIQSFDWGSVCGVCNEPDNIFDRIQEALK